MVLNNLRASVPVPNSETKLSAVYDVWLSDIEVYFGTTLFQHLELEQRRALMPQLNEALEFLLISLEVWPDDYPMTLTHRVKMFDDIRLELYV